MQLNLQDMSDSIKHISKGVLYFNKEPIYMVDRLQSKTEDYLFIYGVRLDLNGEPIKDYYLREKIVTKDGKPFTLLGGDPISDTLIKLIPQKKERYIENKPELYVAPVVEFEDSVTEEFGVGFFIRVPDEYDYMGNIAKEGYPTGVFILLNNIEWFDDFIPIDGIVDEYMIKVQEREYLRGRGDERL